jgi:FtsH-binding integral membrane protein
MSMYPQGYSSQPVPLDYGTDSRVLSRFFNQVYAWMSVGLAWTAVVGLVISSSPSLLKLIYGQGAVMMAVIGIGMFLLALAAQSVAMKVSAAAGLAMFMLYATLMGALISGIFLVYPVSTLAAAFFTTAAVFVVLSLWGYFTKKDLTTIGSLCVAGMIGLFVASIVNLFLASNAMSWVITYGVLIVTLGIVAWKTQELKELALHYGQDQTMLNRLAAVGALILYISFVNLFLSILRILGDRR